MQFFLKNCLYNSIYVTRINQILVQTGGGAWGVEGRLMVYGGGMGRGKMASHT